MGTSKKQTVAEQKAKEKIDLALAWVNAVCKSDSFKLSAGSAVDKGTATYLNILNLVVMISNDLNIGFNLAVHFCMTIAEQYDNATAKKISQFKF